MSEENELSLWIDHAEDDFNVAKRLIRGKNPSLYSTCFHTQQCAEKYMKALLILKEKEFPKTHDLSLLNDLLTGAGIFLGIAEDDLDTLSAYAVGTRYPGASPTLEEAKEAIQISKVIRKLSRTFLGLK